jgi:diacylglycerol kinase
MSSPFRKIASAVNLGDKPVAESLSKLAKDCEIASASVLNRSVNSLTGWGRELMRNSRFENRD